MAVFAANSQHLCMFVGAHTTQEITSLHGAQLSSTWVRSSEARGDLWNIKW